MKMMQKLALAVCVLLTAGAFSGCAGKYPSGSGVTPPETEPGTSFALSHESGVYSSAITLTVSKEDPTHRIFYTFDCSEPTTKSAEYSRAIVISDDAATRSYPFTQAVVHDPSTHGSYTYGTGNACTVVKFLETDAAGNEVSRTTKTYFIREEGASAFPLPVISISMPQQNAVSFYNDTENESKERAEMEYFDFSTGERFALNTQIKLGGNWTKGFPYRTMNVNFNKDENGEKNEPVTVKLFGDRPARDGSELTDFRRFRLHSGGNSQTLTWFGDAFVQRVAAEVPSDNGDFLTTATTGYRPCEVYLNGEYWGLYAIREHYSDVYFEQNYGVDKDDVILVDKAYNIVAGDPAYSDASVFNTTYHFELKEDDEAGQGMALAEELFDFLYVTGEYETISDPEVYAQFEEMVDTESLIDLVLVNMYAGNWDFMNNNVKMWRTAHVDPENPYADGKWRFCLHDLDFSFEMQWGDNGLRNANGYLLYTQSDYASHGRVPISEYTNDTITYRPGANYLDFYLGNAYLTYNGIGQLDASYTCLLSSPARNAAFREAFAARAETVKQIYSSEQANTIINEMQEEVYVPMERHLLRWDRSDYDFNDWLGFVARTCDVLYTRNYLRDDLYYFDGGMMYENGDYFDRQIEAAFWRFENDIHL